MFNLSLPMRGADPDAGATPIHTSAAASPGALSSGLGGGIPSGLGRGGGLSGAAAGFRALR